MHSYNFYKSKLEMKGMVRTSKHSKFKNTGLIFEFLIRQVGKVDPTLQLKDGEKDLTVISAWHDKVKNYLKFMAGNLNLEQNLEFLESIWNEHLLKSCPIQYLCGITFWRDLKLKVTNKVLIPRPETELIIDIVFNIYKKKRHTLVCLD